MLKKEAPQQWISSELADLSQMKFSFKDKENPINKVSWLSEKM